MFEAPTWDLPTRKAPSFLACKTSMVCRYKMDGYLLKLAFREILMSSEAKKRFRVDKETGLPIFVIENSIKNFCHQNVSEQTDDGDVIEVKMRPTMPFFQKLNAHIVRLVEESIMNAREDDRTNLKPEDVPLFGDEEEEDDTED